MYEDNYLENGVGIEMDKFDFLIFEEAMKEIASRVAESTLEM
jgi:hypothetical protein